MRLLQNNLPGTVFADPVLALLHLVGKVVALIILFERDDHEFVLARVPEHRQVRQFDLDPVLARIDLAFLLCELLEVWSLLVNFFE